VTKYCSHRCSARAYKERERKRNVDKSVSETVRQISLEHVELQAKEFLSINEVCELLNLSRRVVSYAVKTKRLKSIRFGRRVVIRRKDVDQLFS
jgi:excisionase family DNA binding protein